MREIPLFGQLWRYALRQGAFVPGSVWPLEVVGICQGAEETDRVGVGLDAWKVPGSPDLKESKNQGCEGDASGHPRCPFPC